MVAHYPGNVLIVIAMTLTLLLTSLKPISFFLCAYSLGLLGVGISCGSINLLFLYPSLFGVGLFLFSSKLVSHASLLGLFFLFWLYLLGFGV